MSILLCQPFWGERKKKPNKQKEIISNLLIFLLYFIFREFSETLLVGNNLDELTDARKKWLSPDGLIFPDRCSLYITAIDNQMLRDRSNYWQHVYTFDMRPMIPAVISEPYPSRVDWRKVNTNATPFLR